MQLFAVHWEESFYDTQGTRDFRLGKNAEEVILGVEAMARQLTFYFIFFGWWSPKWRRIVKM